MCSDRYSYVWREVVFTRRTPLEGTQCGNLGLQVHWQRRATPQRICVQANTSLQDNGTLHAFFVQGNSAFESSILLFRRRRAAHLPGDLRRRRPVIRRTIQAGECGGPAQFVDERCCRLRTSVRIQAAKAALFDNLVLAVLNFAAHLFKQGCVFPFRTRFQ